MKEYCLSVNLFSKWCWEEMNQWSCLPSGGDSWYPPVQVWARQCTVANLRGHPPLSSDGSGGRRSRAVTELDRNQQIHELLTSQCRHTGTPTQPATARDIPAPASRDHPATTRSNINHCSQESNVRNFYLLQKISHRKYLRKIFDSISF